MKYYQITAIKSDNQLIERFFENGKRYIKYIPFNPKIVTALKEQFKGKPIEIELINGWIVITKTGYDEQYAQAARTTMKKNGDEDADTMTVEKLAAAEMDMLKSTGYKVTLETGEVDE